MQIRARNSWRGLFAKILLALEKGVVLVIAAFVGLGRWLQRKLRGRAGDQA